MKQQRTSHLNGVLRTAKHIGQAESNRHARITFDKWQAPEDKVLRSRPRKEQAGDRSCITSTSRRHTAAQAKPRYPTLRMNDDYMML